MNPTRPGGPPANSACLPDDVLIVEDDPLISFVVEETVLELGVKSARTAASVMQALELIGARKPDFALLDIGLVHENSFVVAEHLDELKIPFVFVTGYTGNVGFPDKFVHRTVLTKPYTREDLLAVLTTWRENGPPG